MQLVRTLVLSLSLAAIPALAMADLAMAEEDLRQKAMSALTSGDMEQAAEIYGQLAEADPDDGEAHYRLATAQMELGMLGEAETHFLRAKALGFQAQGADYRLARIHAQRGEADQAIEKLQAIGDAGFGLIQIVEGNPDFAPITDRPGYQAALDTIRGNRYPCTADPRHHDFDFWIGEWNVYNGGQLAGQNSIQPILGHCALFEQWTGGQGGQGKSFNFYDPGYDRWRQVWISDSGSFIEFTGEARDGGIYYTATTKDPDTGDETLHRFNFTPNEDGSVRQHWMQSTDGGETWNTVWDGRYVRKEDDTATGGT